jgi:hypothetical protein
VPVLGRARSVPVPEPPALPGRGARDAAPDSWAWSASVVAAAPAPTPAPVPRGWRDWAPPPAEPPLALPVLFVNGKVDAVVVAGRAEEASVAVAPGRGWREAASAEEDINGTRLDKAAVAEVSAEEMRDARLDSTGAVVAASPAADDISGIRLDTASEVAKVSVAAVVAATASEVAAPTAPAGMTLKDPIDAAAEAAGGATRVERAADVASTAGARVERGARLDSVARVVAATAAELPMVVNPATAALLTATLAATVAATVAADVDSSTATLDF